VSHQHEELLNGLTDKRIAVRIKQSLVLKYGKTAFHLLRRRARRRLYELRQRERWKLSPTGT
jgi:hypothetical protein